MVSEFAKQFLADHSRKEFKKETSRGGVVEVDQIANAVFFDKVEVVKGKGHPSAG